MEAVCELREVRTEVEMAKAEADETSGQVANEEAEVPTAQDEAVSSEETTQPANPANLEDSAEAPVEVASNVR